MKKHSSVEDCAFLSLCRLFRERKRQDLRTSGNLGLLGQGAESFGGELELHATDTLRLDIDRKRAASLHIRVTPIVSGFGAASGQVAYSTHRRKISCLVTDMRVSWIGGNGKCPYVLRVFTFFSLIRVCCKNPFLSVFISSPSCIPSSFTKSRTELWPCGSVIRQRNTPAD